MANPGWNRWFFDSLWPVWPSCASWVGGLAMPWPAATMAIELDCHAVAPHAGAWIETSATVRGTPSARRPPRGGVD